MATFRGLRRAVTAFNPATRHRYFSISACAKAWNKEWLPSKRPKTQEEREAAAKKYGLLPQDYEPYPDDGHGVGDYPKLPDIGGDSRSDWEDYDMPTLKRNYQEPLHYHSDAYSEDRLYPDDPIQYDYMPYWKMLVITLGLFGVMALIGIYEPLKIFPPVMPKQYPYGELYLERGGDPKQPTPDIKHYTFEAAE